MSELKEKILYTKKINDHIYLYDGNHEATAYLVIGNDKALVIDTMAGDFDLKTESRKYTDLPLMVVNTHGHPDHVLGNIYFDEEAYINPDDYDVATEFLNCEEFEEFLRISGRVKPVFKDINVGDVIDLGGLHLEVIGLAGHTPGSILLLLKEDRILFTGDAINHHLWMQLHHSTNLRMFRDNLKKILYLSDEADFILHGHAQGIDDISLLDKTLSAVEEILNRKTDADEVYHWFGGEGRTHKIPGDDGVICYNSVSERVLNDRVSWAASDAKRDEGLKEPEDVTVYRNISYGLFEESNLLDVYVPTDESLFVVKNKDGLNNLPVLINVHGGGYFYGDKELYRFYSMDMARYGFIVVNCNYRLSPEYTFPSALQDINNVVRFVESNAEKYGMDINRVFMMGDSAGAQLTSHYAAINSNSEFASLYALRPTNIKLKGISLACGMYNLPEFIDGELLNECVLDYLGEYKDPKLPILDVLGAITKDYPSTFIFSCPNDFLYYACEPMAELIKSKGVNVKKVIYGTREMEDVGHVFHCNMYTEIGAQCRKEQAEFLLNL